MASYHKPSPDTMAATAKNYLEVCATLNVDTVADLMSENFAHEFRPVGPGIPPSPLDRKGLDITLKHMGGVLRSFPVTCKEVWPNPSLNQVVIWGTADTQFHDHVKDNDDEEEWKRRHEYIWVLTLDESGTKVEHVLEFVDSRATEGLYALAARAFAKKAQVEAPSI